MPAVKFIASDLQLDAKTTEANFVWSNTYMPPTYGLLRMSEKSRKSKEESGKSPTDFPSYFLRPGIRLNFHDLAGKELLTDVKNEMLQLSTRAQLKKKVENFIVLPSHLCEELLAHQGLREKGMQMKSVAYFFPHISIEALPDLSTEMQELATQILDGRVLTNGIFSTIFNWIGHFGLSIYKFEFEDKKADLSIEMRSKVVNSA